MIGLASLLIGAHQFILHPIAVARAWQTLYGPVKDPRLLMAFILHDWGYVTCHDMDGPTGERHVELGAKLMTTLFDAPRTRQAVPTPWGELHLGPWGMFTLLHSRYYSAHLGRPPSRLCAADKLAFTREPAYLPRVKLTGELREYLEHARAGRYPGMRIPRTDNVDTERHWYAQTYQHMQRWALHHAWHCTPEPSRHAEHSEITP